MWSNVERVVPYDAYILFAIRYYRTIEFDQKLATTRMPHIADSKLFILWRHKASRRVLFVLVIIVVLSSSRRGCKVCALPVCSGRMFYYLPTVSYILQCHAMLCDVNVTWPISCNVAKCGTMWHDVARCGAMWCNVARCGAMWRDVAQCGVMWD